MNRNEAIGISPFQAAGSLQGGFVISGRWPDTTQEWAQLLALAVRVARCQVCCRPRRSSGGSVKTFPKIRSRAPSVWWLPKVRYSAISLDTRPFLRPSATGADHAAPTVGNHAQPAGMRGQRVGGVRTAARPSLSGFGASCGVGRG